MYHNPALWPTRDGVVPHKRFYQMLWVLEHVRARQRLEDTMATAHAIGMAMAGKDQAHKVKRQTRKLIEAAYPEV